MTRPVLALGNLSTGTAVPASTTETILRSLSVPYGMLGTGFGVEYSLHGSIVTADTTNPTMTIRTRMGTSTTLGTLVMETSALTLATSTSSRPWSLEGGVIGTSTATQRHWIRLDLGGAGIGITPSTASFVGIGDSTNNHTDLIQLQLTAQMSAASTEYTINADVGTYEAVR